MMNYIYYRAYSFYEKNKLAIDPHTYAAGIPTLMQGFIVYLLYYLFVRYRFIKLIDGNILIYGVVMLGLYYLNDKFFAGRIKSYKKKWSEETNSSKVLKGTVIAILTLASFIGILLVANGLYKLKLR